MGANGPHAEQFDVLWYGANGPIDFSEEPRSFVYFLDGRSQQDDDPYVMINMSPWDTYFSIQESAATGAPADIVDACSAPLLGGNDYLVEARFVVVLLHPSN